MFRLRLFLIKTIWSSYPIYENLILIEVDGTFKVKFPLLSVMVPMVVPSTITLTPAIGSPDWSLTFPFTEIVCCDTWDKPVVCFLNEVGMLILSPACIFWAVAIPIRISIRLRDTSFSIYRCFMVKFYDKVTCFRYYEKMKFYSNVFKIYSWYSIIWLKFKIQLFQNHKFNIIDRDINI